MTKPGVEPWVAELVRQDIESAIQSKDPGSLRNYAAEAEASGMPEEAERAFEVASLIESWMAKNNRAELLRIKSAMAPTPPSQSELIQAFHKLVLDRAAPFSTATYEEDEARRVQAQNEQLAERDRMFEEQRRQSAPDEPGPTPWWRR
jgi:hypothetical protein